MGFRGHEHWQDISDFVVHFTKPSPTSSAPPEPAPPATPGRLTFEESIEQLRAIRAKDRTGYAQMESIWASGELRPGAKPLGAARDLVELGDSQRVVCFSEIPLDQLPTPEALTRMQSF